MLVLHQHSVCPLGRCGVNAGVGRAGAACRGLPRAPQRPGITAERLAGRLTRSGQLLARPANSAAVSQRFCKRSPGGGRDKAGKKLARSQKWPGQAGARQVAAQRRRARRRAAAIEAIAADCRARCRAFEAALPACACYTSPKQAYTYGRAPAQGGRRTLHMVAEGGAVQQVQVAGSRRDAKMAPARGGTVCRVHAGCRACKVGPPGRFHRMKWLV